VNNARKTGVKLNVSGRTAVLTDSDGRLARAAPLPLRACTGASVKPRWEGRAVRFEEKQEKQFTTEDTEVTEILKREKNEKSGFNAEGAETAERF
jgi:hypothetical protein